MDRRVERDPEEICILNKIIWNRKYRCIFGLEEADVLAVDSFLDIP